MLISRALLAKDIHGMSLGLSGQRGVHEVYITIYDVLGRHLALHDLLQFFANDQRSITDAIHLKSHLREILVILLGFFNQRSSHVSCSGHVFRLPRIHWGC